MNNKNKIEEAKAVKTFDEAACFVKKYCPEINATNEEIKFFLEQLAGINVAENIFAYDGKVFITETRDTYIKKIKALEKTREKITQGTSEYFIRESDALRDYLSATDNLINFYKAISPERSKGEKKDGVIKGICEMLAFFWGAKLHHKNFIYDEGNYHDDLANNFCDTIFMLLYEKDISEIRGAREALRNISDKRSLLRAKTDS